jgi:thiol-disulfide isomerase/thioredoxin
MKKFYFLALALIIAAGCATGAGSDVALTVSVNSPVADDVVAVCHNDIHTLKLDESGTAVLNLSGIDAAYLTLYHGRQYIKLYVEGGDDASLTFDGCNMAGSFVIEGGKSAAAKYLNNVKLIPLPDEDYALPFDEYRTRLAGKEADAVKLLEAMDLSGEGSFKKVEAARIKYAYGSALLMYPVGHMIMSADPDFKPEQSYYDFIASYVVEDELFAALDEYREFVSEAMHVLDADNRELTDIYPKTVAQMRYAADHLKNPQVKAVIMHHIATRYVDNFGVKDIDELKNLYYTYVTDPAMSAAFEAKFERWDLSRPGRMSPGFRAVDIEGKTWTLNDFRGKYVYIDMWATWCAPCRQEMPHLKRLEAQFKDAQIVFLGLSVDSDKAKWEKMASSGDLTGTQLYLGTQSSFQEAYRIEGIPRFILLDKNGVIISNDMSRPSEPKTAETLNSLEGIR